ncbi:MAG: hypothetical protein RIA69_04220 [Cyclobacteriaceae bacterium]
MNNSIYTDFGLQSTLIEPLFSEREKEESFNGEQILVRDAGYLFSIELRREQLRKEMESIFTFSNDVKELDFVSNNEEIRAILPSIGKFFMKEISSGSILNLELMEEENNWKTLFINIPVNEKADWDALNDILDSFYDNMFDFYPTVMEKLNIDLVVYEF